MIQKNWKRKRDDFPRDWLLYHEELILRGEFLFDLDFLENWDNEVAQMNKGKRGAPFQYPDSLFEWLSPMSSFLDSRKLEGAMRKMKHHIPKLRVCDHSTIVERLNRLNLDIEFDRKKSYRIGIDTTGNKVTNRGEYMRHKWKTRRGWIKVSVVIDRYSKELLDVEVALDSVTDEKLAKKHLDNLQDLKIDDAAMDGAYYREGLFRILQQRGIFPVIKMPTNASTNGLDPMHTQVRNMQEMGGFGPWRDAYGYNLRWNNENKNSAVKRCFGECVRSHKKENCFKEAKNKFINYERMKKYAQNRVSA